MGSSRRVVVKVGNTMSAHFVQNELSRAAKSSTRRHERVLDEAARQLNAKGVSLTSLTEIAEKLGISRAAMYYYVADRDDLVFQCYRRSCEITKRHLDEAMAEQGTAVDVLTRFVKRMLDPAEPELAARPDNAMMTAAQRDAIRGLYDELAARMQRLLTAGQDQGVIRACDVEINAHIVLGVTTWGALVHSWANKTQGVTAGSLSAAVLATLLDGLARDRTAPPEYVEFDLSPLATRGSAVFDRDALSEAKRETLVSVASRLFNRKGIDATSLEEIAGQVGATKRTLHRHLGSKQALVEACYRRAFKIFCHIKNAMVAHSGTRLEALGSAAHALAIAYPREDLSPLSPVIGFDAVSSIAQETFTHASTRLSEAYRETIRKGIMEGSIGDIDVEARLVVLPGIWRWLVTDNVPSDDARRKYVADEIAKFAIFGLRR
jgi:AcrR family transcriptional regulator